MRHPKVQAYTVILVNGMGRYQTVMVEASCGQEAADKALARVKAKGFHGYRVVSVETMKEGV